MWRACSGKSDSITTRRREIFYWTAVLTTFALGTAAGDFTARTLGLGWLLSVLLFAALMALPALIGLKVKLNAVFAFWWAYIITRPLGASFADWVAVPHAQGGVGLGTGTVTLSLSLLILVLVVMLVFNKGHFGWPPPDLTTLTAEE